MCSVLAQTFSRPLYGGEFLMGGKGSEERWGEYGHIHIALYSCCFTSCMQGREFDNRAEEKKKKKNQVKQRYLTLSLTSARYSLAPGIHFTAQIEWAASKWSEVEQPCALIKNRSGSCISSTNFAENICEDVIIVTAAPTDRECHHDYI